MSDDPLKGFSHEGPKCPECGHVRRRLEESDYNQSGYEMECDNCGTTSAVQPQVQWWWTSRVIE